MENPKIALITLQGGGADKIIQKRDTETNAISN